MRFDDASTSTLLFIIVVIEGFVNIFTGVLRAVFMFVFFSLEAFFYRILCKSSSSHGDFISGLKICLIFVFLCLSELLR